VRADDFHRYIAAFNGGDFDGFGAFYHPEVDFAGRGGNFHGRDAVLGFYRDVKSRVRHKLTVHGVVARENTIVADVETELHPLEDWPDFATGALRKGETLRSQNFIWYDIQEGRFTRIRSAHYRRLSADERVIGTQAAADAGMTAHAFASYIDAFNRDDYAAFGACYHEDVVLTIAGKRELRGRQAIFDFYRAVKAQTRRTIEINDVVTVGNQLAAELQSEFVALEDLPDFAAGPLKTGGRLFINTVALYELRDGRFARIRSGTLRRIAWG
jgi:ketosteroid isomerase-like protein